MAAMQLMKACGLQLVSSDFNEYSFTDPREDGQLSWLMVNGRFLIFLSSIFQPIF